MTGWRVGWAIFPDNMMETVERLAQNMYIGPPRPMQAGAMAAFDDYGLLYSHVDRYRENRDILTSRLPAEFLGDLACDGAFYLYADISQLGMKTPDSTVLAEAMLREANVACTPGVDFDQEQGICIWLSFAGSTAAMRKPDASTTGFPDFWRPAELASGPAAIPPSCPAG